MALVLILQLLTLWPLGHTDITSNVPPASYPKPSLGAQPASVVTPGMNVTLTCRAPQPSWRFALFKSGELAPLLYQDVFAELAEFFLQEVTEAQGGSYQCRYRSPRWSPGAWSQPSDALELLVTDQLPRPSLRPGARGRARGGLLTACLPRRLLGSPGSDRLDYTKGNLVRLALAGLVLACLAALVGLEWRSWRRAPASA
ncbi:PREDICTED: osteoclast-associated immunoglobulin-like receptor [Miniopterus natalensis]|uniref:osteoclast-associated immunoglobulin-like receptor n=1 Tax=Miniopterus natalensis TaxID=291302 RepID=UPI0007A6C14F|nr:PREDICTED: osteoclast-associated immunoglobulin-like receptor [Miniopterus natalensis]